MENIDILAIVEPKVGELFPKTSKYKLSHSS